MKNINYKKVIYLIIKWILILMILSVFARMLYEIANNVYQKRKRESNEIQQNEVNTINVQDNSNNIIENKNQEKWYVNWYWNIAIIVFIIYAFYNYRKKWYNDFFTKKID